MKVAASMNYTKLKRTIFTSLVPLLLIGIQSEAGAQYYGFGFPSPSLNIITNSVANDAFRRSVTDSADEDQNAPPPRQPATNPAALRYTPDLAVRKRNLAGFIAKTRAQSPENADQMAQLFSSTDVFAAMAQALKPEGLRIDNVADTYTVYWITAWETSRGIVGGENDQIKIQAVKAQATRGLLASPEFVNASSALKQEMAEALLIQTALISASAGAAVNDPAQLKAVGNAVRTGAKAMGLDLDAMELNDSGFEATRRR